MTVSLVTGGCGFVGAAIARGLKARGDHVIVLDVAPQHVQPQVKLDHRQALLLAAQDLGRIALGGKKCAGFKRIHIDQPALIQRFQCLQCLTGRIKR